MDMKKSSEVASEEICWCYSRGGVVQAGAGKGLSISSALCQLCTGMPWTFR